jgi:flagellar hook-basal body complex protein FliE
VDAKGLPSVRFSPSGAAESFGGAAASQAKALGAGLQNLGEGASKALAVYELKSQDRKDKSIVRDKLNAAESDIRTFEGDLRRPENRTKAIDAYATAQQHFTDLRKKYGGELGNDRQRELFAASFDGQMNGALDRAYALQESSRTTYEKMTRDAQNQSAVDNAIAARNDPKAIADSEMTVIANTKASAVGIPPEVITKAVEDARHNLHASVLSSLQQDSPVAAQGYLKTNWDKFNPATRENLKKEIDDKAFDWTVRDTADRLVNAGLTDKEIEAQIKAVDDPKKADALRQRVRDNLDDRRVAREIQQKENVFSAWDDVMNGSAIPYGRLSGQEIKAMEVYKRADKTGFAQESDGATLVTLGRLTDQELKNVDEVTMASYGNKLTRDDFNALFTRYRDLRRGVSTGVAPEKLTQIRTDASMVTDALTALGIDPSAKKKGLAGARDKKPEEKAQDQQTINDLTRSFQREINDVETARGGKLMPAEKQQILDDLLIKGKKKGFWGNTKDAGFLFQSEDSQIDSNFSIKDIPQNLQEQLNEAFKLRGVPATEENIRMYYTEYLKSRKK